MRSSLPCFLHEGRCPFVEVLDLSDLDDHESSRTFRAGGEATLLLTKGISEDALGHGIRKKISMGNRYAISPILQFNGG
jgi:hypothetical protein